MSGVLENLHFCHKELDMDQAKPGESMTEKVAAIIDKLRPLLQGDGGDIELVGVNETTGAVSVRLQGACKGCPGAAMTLKMGVERHLKEKVPGVKEVVNVQ
jgi:Fe-S cluster biogenesis protein NfuA